MTIEAGQHVHHYHLIEQIGEGGMGVVWKAEDTRLHRHVALKFVPEESAEESDVVGRHLREARAASALNHPHICSVYDVGEWQGRHFIVMELLEGRPLDEEIEGRPMAAEAAIELAIQIADALAAAHAKGIVHRDIKPANIFVVGSEAAGRRAKILDFGLAKLVAGAQEEAGDSDATRTALGITAPGSVMGTVAYMSPEQALGKELDERTDIFSLGAVLYEMLTARRAFSGQTAAEVFDAILNRTPPTPASRQPEVPRELERILERALEKDPGLRYQSAAGMSADLKRMRRASSEAGVPAGMARPARRGWPMVLAVVVLALLAWQLASFLRQADPEVPDPEVPAVEGVTERLILAVLPFENIGADPEQEFFADGMTDEMITVLGSASPDRLGVIARTSAMRFKGSDVSVKEIGASLGTSHVVEGSVRRQENLVRISATLIDVSDETQVWTGTFDGTLEDIFGLQSRVAGEIAQRLAVTLLPGPSRAARGRAPDPAAYEEYLSGRFWEHKGSEEGFKRAIEHYRNAVEIDPEYALAYASMSQSYTSLSTWTTVSPAGLVEEAERAMNRAFELDPELADAQVAKALHQAYGRWEWPGADATFARALGMNPTNPEVAHHWYGHYLSFAGRHQDALSAFDAALNLDPLSFFHQACRGLAQILAGDLDLADRSLRRALELAPEFPLAHDWSGLLRERQGRLEEAVAAWEKAALHGGRKSVFLAPLGYGYGRLGETAKARAVLEELETGGEYGYVAALNLARVHAGLGDADRAFEQLEIAFEEREPWIVALRIGPGFDTIRDDPRFADLLRRIGIEG